MLFLENSFEGELVRYYDMFFLQKGAEKEAQYVKNMAEEYISATSLLDVGCGTGIHAEEFAKYFDKVAGIDISKDMVAYAKEKHLAKNIEYEVQDIRKWNLHNEYDIVTALSHVIGYQLDNLDVEKMLLGVNGNLRENGIFIFNFYNEPQLLNGSLKARTKIVEKDGTKITRFSNATPDTMENELLLDYYYIIENCEQKAPVAIEIHEKMRYFTLKEISYYLEKAGFKILQAFDWNFSGEGVEGILRLNSWNAGIVAKKQRHVRRIV